MDRIRPPSTRAESQGGVSYTTYILEDNSLFTCEIVPGGIPVYFDGRAIGLNEEGMPLRDFGKTVLKNYSPIFELSASSCIIS